VVKPNRQPLSKAELEKNKLLQAFQILTPLENALVSDEIIKPEAAPENPEQKELVEDGRSP